MLRGWSKIEKTGVQKPAVSVRVQTEMQTEVQQAIRSCQFWEILW